MLTLYTGPRREGERRHDPVRLAFTTGRASGTNIQVVPPFELFDHTADIGIRARAPTLPELLVIAGQGLYAVIGDFVASGEPQWTKIQLTGSDAATLLRDYLDELLVIFDRDHRFATSVQVSRFDDHELSVSIETDLVDEERSVFHREVKAITYHALEIRQTAGGYEATVILDI